MSRELVKVCLRCVALGMIFAIGKQGYQCKNNEYEFDMPVEYRALNPDMCVDYYTESDSVLKPWKFTRRIPRNLSTARNYNGKTLSPTSTIKPFTSIAPLSTTPVQYDSTLHVTVESSSTPTSILESPLVQLDFPTTHNPVTTQGVITLNTTIPSVVTTVRTKKPRSGKRRKTSTSSTQDTSTPGTVSTDIDLMEVFTRDNAETTIKPLAEIQTDDAEATTTKTANTGAVVISGIFLSVTILLGFLAWRKWIRKQGDMTSQGAFLSGVAVDDGIELMDLGSTRNSLYIIPEEQEESINL